MSKTIWTEIKESYKKKESPIFVSRRPETRGQLIRESAQATDNEGEKISRKHFYGIQIIDFNGGFEDVIKTYPKLSGSKVIQIIDNLQLYGVGKIGIKLIRCR